MKNIVRKLTVAVMAGCSLLILSGCSKSTEPASQTASADNHGHDHGPGSDHDHGSGSAQGKEEQSGLPHGGTPVQVGDHGYHLELVNDPTEGKMLAYVLDAHMEKAVNVPATTFEMIAKTGGEEHRLTFTAVTNAPNATEGKTAVFSAPAAGLAKAATFEGVIPKITLDGKTFENLTFSYPKGTRHIH